MKQQSDSDLLDSVSEITSDKLAEAVSHVEQLDKEALEGAKRLGTHHVNQHWVKIRICLYWGFSILSAIVLAVVVVVLLWNHMEGVLKDPKQVAETLSFVWNTFLIILATLFINNKFGSK